MTGNMVGDAAPGAMALASRATTFRTPARKPTPTAAYPPIPQLWGAMTASMNPAATAASNALPARPRMLAPASDERRLGETQSAAARIGLASRPTILDIDPSFIAGPGAL